MQQVGRGVVPPDGVAALAVHRRGHPVADPQPAPRDPHVVGARGAGRDALHAVDLGREGAAGRGQPSRVRHLSAGLEVERRPIEDHVPRRPGAERGDGGTSVVEQSQDRRLVDLSGPVPVELVGRGQQRRALRVGPEGEPDRLRRPEPRPRPRLAPLRLEAPLEAAAVDGHVPFAGHILDEVQGQPEGVVQAEDLLPGQYAAVGLRQRRLEAGQTVGQHRVEPVLLGPHHSGYRLAAGPELGIRASHLAGHHVDEAVQERAGHAQLLAVAHRAPHDLAQHVAAPLVRGHDAVADEEGHRAQVVGDDPHRDVVGRRRAARRQRAVDAAGRLADGAQQRREQVGVVVRGLLLDDRDDALQPHAGVDGRGGQRGQLPARVAVELHEHVVPDLDVALATAVDAPASGLVAGDVVAAVVMDLRAPAAGAGVAHRPEVVLGPHLDDAPGGDEPAPRRVRLVVAGNAPLPLEDRRDAAGPAPASRRPSAGSTRTESRRP